MYKQVQNISIFLKDYQAPKFKLHSCVLDFKLNAQETRLVALYEIEALESGEPLVLDGDRDTIKLIQISLDDKALSKTDYQTDANALSIHVVPKRFKLSISIALDPSSNTNLNGLYQSGDMLCTQCEAQGFRRICYGFDRPDVLSTYTVKITADKQLYPVLLSNGNLIEQGEIAPENASDPAQHYATWHDPFPKPSYLFALVAGNLQRHSDTFITRSGKTVDLHVLTRPEEAGKTQHAMASLQRAMRWDERAYNREYDLDVYHIVAVSDFNMGAMENKSLNVFNSKYVLARPEIATDQDFHGIEGVIGHEYFHNWSGNRVTCRDWFQLSLKEGFTVLRDQQFSGDMGSQGVQRINDVSLLRSVQFKEDAGPMAHPIRPESYEEINNFYTVTVYEKGAEVVRMLHTLLGETQFKLATDHYFKTFDGMAVTTDDFVDSMQEVSKIDLSQFRLWYSQAGTPEVSLRSEYDAKLQRLSLHFTQNMPENSQAKSKAAPLLIPIRIALFDAKGKAMDFGFESNMVKEAVLKISKAQETIVLEQLESLPVISPLRGFSAPIKLHFDQNPDTLAFLAQNDDDPFARWEAMQKLSLIHIQTCMLAFEKDQKMSELPKTYLSLFGKILADKNTDPALLAQLLVLPSESIIGQQMQTIEPDLIHTVRKGLRMQIAKSNQSLLRKQFDASNAMSLGNWTSAETGHRALRDACLSLLMLLETSEVHTLAIDQYQQARCMTDSMAALSSIVHSKLSSKQDFLDDFYHAWKEEALLINKWFNLQSQETEGNALLNINKLTQHADFDANNPNKVYALIGGFLHANSLKFHAQDGSGYAFASKWILKLDAINPQVAARMVGCFNQWKRYNPALQALMKKQMQIIADHKGLSKDVSEIIHKALA